MAEATDTASPLDRLDFEFLQPLVSRLLAGIRAPAGLDQAAHTAHDQAIIILLEDLDPRSPVEAAVASMFVSAHYGSMANARAALRFPAASRECARVTSLGAGLGRLALQAVRLLWQRQGVAEQRRGNIDPMQSGERQPGGAAPASEDAPERQHPMSSGGAQPGGTGDDARGRFDPMQSGGQQPGGAAPASEAAPERQHPMSSGGAPPAGTGDDARGGFDRMPSEPGLPGAHDAAVRLSWRTSSPDEPSGTGRTANERQHPMSSGETQRPKPEYTSSGKLIPHGSLYRPDGTPWHEPPACWAGPSWLAHRFPLDPAERLSQWTLKACDELTPEMRRLAWGYVHEPGVLEAHEARMAAEAAEKKG